MKNAYAWHKDIYQKKEFLIENTLHLYLKTSVNSVHLEKLLKWNTYFFLMLCLALSYF